MYRIKEPPCVCVLCLIHFAGEARICVQVLAVHSSQDKDKCISISAFFDVDMRKGVTGIP